MPTYEYRCDNCATNFDVVQSFHDDPLTECPTCGSPVRKVFGSVGIVFKGSGFYKTDSRSGGSATKTAESRPLRQGGTVVGPVGQRLRPSTLRRGGASAGLRTPGSNGSRTRRVEGSGGSKDSAGPGVGGSSGPSGPTARGVGRLLELSRTRWSAACRSRVCRSRVPGRGRSHPVDDASAG